MGPYTPTHTRAANLALKVEAKECPWLHKMKKQAPTRTRQTQYPPELIVLSLLLMGDGMQASRVNGAVYNVLRQSGLLDTDEDIGFPKRQTLGNWRYGMNHVCRVQIGMCLTRMSVDKNQVLTGDGTPVRGRHVEGAILTTRECCIAMVPWIQVGNAMVVGGCNT